MRSDACTSTKAVVCWWVLFETCLDFINTMRICTHCVSSRQCVWHICDNVSNFCICIIIHLWFLDIFNGQLFFKKLTTFTDYQSIPKIFFFHYSINKIFFSYFHSATLPASYYFNWREFLSSNFSTVIHAFWY